MRLFKNRNSGAMFLIFEGIVFTMVLNLYNPFIQMFAKRMGAQNIHIALLNAVPPLVAVFILIPCGILIERINRKKQTVLVLLFVLSLFYAAIAFIPSISHQSKVLVYVVLIGLMNWPGALYLTTWQSFFADHFKGSYANRVYSLRSKYGTLFGLLTVLVTGLLLTAIPKSDGERLFMYQIFYGACFVLTLLQLFFFSRVYINDSESLQAEGSPEPGAGIPSITATGASQKPEAGETPKQHTDALPKPEAGETPKQHTDALPKPEAGETPKQHTDALPKPEAGETPKQHTDALPKPEAGVSLKPSMMFTRLNFKEMLSNKPFVIFCVCGFAFHLAWQMGWPLYFIYYADYAKLNEFQLGLVSVAFGFTQFLSYSIWSRLIDKKGSSLMIIFGAAGMASSPLIFTVLWSFPVILLINIFLGIFMAGFNLSLFFSLLETLPDGKKTVYISVFNTLTNITGFIAPLIGIWIFNHTNIFLALGLIGVLRVCATLLYVFRWWKARSLPGIKVEVAK